ncbi:MAG: DUF58 domain-containing protein [Acidobacteria bacterium]|nr:DUF58 domain-containing protein [Acidobacteriota bacterium]
MAPGDSVFRRWLGVPAPAETGDAEAVRRRLQAQVKNLEIRARRAMTEGFAGEYSSAFRGRGLEFEEVREYRLGDDVRTIDWNVTARTGRLHVKLYREERDLTVLLLIDLSASTRFGSGVMTVHDLIAEVASLFALARRDRVGAILFDDTVRTVIPPRQGWRHGLRVVREVLAAEPAGNATSAAEAVRTAARLLKGRGIVVAVVDRTCPMPRKEIRALAARHELLVVRAGDPLLEGKRPPAALPVREAEGRRRGVLAEPRPMLRRPGLPGVDVLDLSTSQDYLTAVRELLRQRDRRRAA